MYQSCHAAQKRSWAIYYQPLDSGRAILEVGRAVPSLDHLGSLSVKIWKLVQGGRRDVHSDFLVVAA